MGEPFKNEYFTHAEADLLARKQVRVRSLVNFSGVDAGTMGRVTGWYEHPRRKFGVNVRWDCKEGQYPLVDGFSKSEYQLFLAEVD